jgi:hypothetical protein
MNTIYPYQQTLIDAIQEGGFKNGELLVYAASRGTGKSIINQRFQTYASMMAAKFSILNQIQEDGATWYTISCINEISNWLLEQPEELQQSCMVAGYTVVSQHVIHEKLFTMMALKYS